MKDPWSQKYLTYTDLPSLSIINQIQSMNVQKMEFFFLIVKLFHEQEWEPLSVQQRHAASIVEIFRIIEEVCRPTYFHDMIILNSVQTVGVQYAKTIFFALCYLLIYLLFLITFLLYF